MLTATLSTPVEVLLYVILVVAVIAFASFFGRCIHDAAEPIAPPVEPETPADLDDWLAGTSLDFNFKVWKRPVASTSMKRGA